MKSVSEKKIRGHRASKRARSMHDVAWRGMWICVRSKDVQKQLARTLTRPFCQYLGHVSSNAKSLCLFP